MFYFQNGWNTGHGLYIAEQITSNCERSDKIDNDF